MATIRQRGDKYYVIYYHKGKQHWQLAGDRVNDAKRIKANIEKGIYEGTHQEMTNITFKAHAQEWLEMKKTEVRPATFAAYVSSARRPIKAFGGKKLKTITPKDIDRLIKSLNEEDISPTTAARVLGTTKSIFEKAVQYGYIPSNPAAYAKGPKKLKVDIDFLEPGEIKRLLSAAEELDTTWSGMDHQRDYLSCRKTIIMFACLTGCRQSEILGLSWSNVDLEAGRIYIRQVYLDGRFFPPKSAAGRRTVDIPPVLVEELKTHQIRQALELSEEGYKNKANLVFTTITGTPMDKRNVTRRILDPALELAGLRKVGFHSLRHSYVSMLIAGGENVKTIQALVGHASAGMTWDTYGHLFEGAGKAAVNRLQDNLFGDEANQAKEHFANGFANESPKNMDKRGKTGK